MNKRLVFLIFAVIFVIITSFAQETNRLESLMQTSKKVEVEANEREKATEETLDLQIPTPPTLEPTQTVEEIKASEESITLTPLEIAKSDVNIGLSADIRQQEATLLNKLLSDEYVLYTKTLKFHWNVQGIVFHSFHMLFKEQYELLFEFVDMIAERIRALGAPAIGSLQEFSTYTQLKELSAKTKQSAIEMIQELLNDHETIIHSLRTGIETMNQLGDQGTSNFLQELLVKHEKIAWMLRATLES